MDLRLSPINSEGVILYDLLMNEFGQLDETAELESAVLVALCSDAVASESDTLPTPGSTDLRGWWADENAGAIWPGAWPIGSKLWLLKRSKIVDAGAREGATLTRVQTYIAQALQPFIDLKVCSNITINCWEEQGSKIYAQIVMYRGPKQLLSLQFAALWNELYPLQAQQRI
jgi:phage gp46-like protein